MIALSMGDKNWDVYSISVAENEIRAIFIYCDCVCDMLTSIASEYLRNDNINNSEQYQLRRHTI